MLDLKENMPWIKHRFTSKTHSRMGIAGTVLSLVLLILYLILVQKAFSGNGALSIYYGSAGILALMLSVLDLGMAVRSEKDENSFKLFPHLALIGAILSLFLWGGTFVIGLIG